MNQVKDDLVDQVGTRLTTFQLELKQWCDQQSAHMASGVEESIQAGLKMVQQLADELGSVMSEKSKREATISGAKSTLATLRELRRKLEQLVEQTPVAEI